MKSWLITAPLAMAAAASIFAAGERRRSERLSGVAEERLRVAESYAKAEDLARIRARDQARLARRADELNAPFRPGRGPSPGTWEAQVREQVARFEREAAHWAALKEKYLAAAKTPWNDVEPGPPAPPF